MAAHAPPSQAAVKRRFPNPAPLLGIALISSVASIAAEEVASLTEVVVEASRNTALNDSFAGSATIISEEEIKESGVRSLAEILSTKGVRVSSTSGNPGNGALHLRGFGENSSSRVLMLVDGKPANRPDMGAVSLLEVPLSRIASVEILRGSHTAKFGDNAVGGVINIITKRGSPRPEGFIEMAGGSDDYFLSRLGYSGVFGGNGLGADFERNISDGWRENSASEIESASLRWDRDLSCGSADASLSWADEYHQFPGPLTDAQYHDDPRQSNYANADQYFYEQTSWRADGTLRFGKGDGWAFDVPLAWSSRDQFWNFGPGSHTDNILETFSLRPTLRYRTERWNAETGFGFRKDTLDLTQFTEIERRTRIGGAALDREIAGWFGSADFEISKQWHVGIAARVERSEIDATAANDQFPWDPTLNFSRGGSEMNQAFQLGVKWNDEQGRSAWLRYDRLYRLPSTDEIASYQGYPMQVPFNDQLVAETGHQVELGGEISKDRWELRLNGFIQWLEGEIAYDYLENLNMNLADTRRWGIEAHGSWRSDRWEIAARYSWLVAKFQDGDYARKNVYLVPRHEAGATVTFRPTPETLARLGYAWTGDSYEGNDFPNTREKLPPYGVANLMFRWEPVPGVSVYVRVNNLLNERYATVKYSGVWYPAAGRQMVFGMRKDF
jgi:iron complex outermembrane receptor protein